MKRRMAGVLALIMLCVGFVGCEPKERVVTISSSNSYSGATSIVMREQKVLEKYLPEGVKVQWVSIVSGPDIRDALVAGKVDIADLAMSTYIMAKENGMPLTLLSYSGASSINLYSNKSDVQSIAELSTQSKITVNALSSNLHIAFLAMLKENGISTNTYDTSLVPMPHAEAIAALGTNSVDASILSFPAMDKTKSMENVHLLEDMTGAIQKYNIGSVIGSADSFYNDNKDIVDAFAKAQAEVLGLFESDPDLCADVLASVFQTDKQAVLEQMDILPPSNLITGYDNLAGLLYEVGILKKPAATFDTLHNYENIPR